MDWSKGGDIHSHTHDSCHHGHSGHSHSHGPREAAFSRMGLPSVPSFHGQFGNNADEALDLSQQPKKRSHLDDSSSWDIVKASQFGILDRCKELVEAGYDVRQLDKENVSLLHWAAINNRLELVKYYISKGAIVDQLGGDLNSTPLHWSIRQGHLPMVIQLIRYGADPSIADGEGYRALHLAILFQHMAIAAYLMAKGQEVDGPDCNGQTPLMLAAQKIIGPEPTNFLIKNNASVSAVDKVNRNTPLHCAVLAGNVDAAYVLLEAGASLDLENINGHTPLELAHQVHSPLLIYMLNQVKQERIRANSRCLRIITKYKVFLQFLLSTAMFGCLAAILDMNSDSWLLKGILLVCVVGAVSLASSPHGHSATVQVLFTLNATALLYYYFRACRTDPGFVKATEEEKKMNVLLLAEAGCLDPSIFCTSCMIKKPVRASHCQRCDACVAKQDHHSVWTNTCIGARNHLYFVLFLLSLFLMGVWMFYGCLVYWSTHCIVHYEQQGLVGGAFAVVDCSPWLLCIFLLALYHTCWSSFILLLQLYQIAFLGLTTAERMSLMMHARKHGQSLSFSQNPYNSDAAASSNRPSSTGHNSSLQAVTSACSDTRTWSDAKGRPYQWLWTKMSSVFIFLKAHSQVKPLQLLGVG
ncbi:putative palmitoyltransferase ZDHHC13 isoform X1 [Syngnathoides biaculeatus]|uniref:putative palmitoyltransferase ZDHHC13 isoform X1 n=2 Tax=Syngnathoides biaculeatus TaxID=300417 RepID=UPI002ADD8850|nr:putative palmitoyltransferase ZDHHC13 isoform X1 [Syngnathoides biaculeatus]